mmetsp:Transcript_51959/g.92723  ORF Transcript_51959/g.92723 Transcript_51959/m.92723 type:complete len:233 (+) Transcript_51959:1175-1873(+)
MFKEQPHRGCELPGHCHVQRSVAARIHEIGVSMDKHLHHINIIVQDSSDQRSAVHQRRGVDCVHVHASAHHFAHDTLVTQVHCPSKRVGLEAQMAVGFVLRHLTDVGGIPMVEGVEAEDVLGRVRDSDGHAMRLHPLADLVAEDDHRACPPLRNDSRVVAADNVVPHVALSSNVNGHLRPPIPLICRGLEHQEIAVELRGRVLGLLPCPRQKVHLALPISTEVIRLVLPRGP